MASCRTYLRKKLIGLFQRNRELENFKDDFEWQVLERSEEAVKEKLKRIWHNEQN
jgi:hypothetical protein